MSGSDVSGNDVSSSDAFESDVSNRIRVNLDGLNMNDGQNWFEFNLENDMSNLRLKVGMLFKSKDSLKEADKQYVVRIDTNNGIYPFAYVAVESENQASWLWFLGLLAIDLKIGLLEAICMLFPKAETRHCVRHVHANFKKAGFQTKELKDFLWKVARASTTRDFENAMDELKKTNQHAYDWLKEKNPTH
ncbi:hypothetical protein PVK06_004646 [Gossypium arboreum]|uniref:MULE transposase domain-containing protein n=1 Tax=Gossypium arboreum TaxID=29729 RepID=A0ABR0QSK1_GOSAR|nr:hypothetical protein PVK06_004646 [Gossypium arboreum]